MGILRARFFHGMRAWGMLDSLNAELVSLMLPMVYTASEGRNYILYHERYT